MTQAVLDEATRQRLAAEVDRLVAMDIDRRDARRIVWDDYQDELAASLVATPAPPVAVPVPEPPASVPPPNRPFWRAEDEPPLTPEWLERNRRQLAHVKRLLR